MKINQVLEKYPINISPENNDLVTNPSTIAKPGKRPREFRAHPANFCVAYKNYDPSKN